MFGALLRKGREHSQARASCFCRNSSACTSFGRHRLPTLHPPCEAFRWMRMTHHLMHQHIEHRESKATVQFIFIKASFLFNSHVLLWLILQLFLFFFTLNYMLKQNCWSRQILLFICTWNQLGPAKVGWPHPRSFCQALEGNDRRMATTQLALLASEIRLQCNSSESAELLIYALCHTPRSCDARAAPSSNLAFCKLRSRFVLILYVLWKHVVPPWEKHFVEEVQGT